MAVRISTLIHRTRRAEPHTPVATDGTMTSLALTLLAAAALMAILSWAREVFIPIVLSVLISYALEPLVLGLMRLRLSRLIASALIVIFATGAVGWMGYSLSDDATAIVAEIPDAAARIRRTLRTGGANGGTLTQVKKAADELQKTADEAAGPNRAPAGVQRVQIEEPAIDVRQYLTWGSAGLLGF